MFFDRQSRILRAFGFKSDQEGIVSRHLRERGGWNPHLNNTQQAIVASMQTKKRGVALVLGSGWLLDVPIEALSQGFERVVLVDIFHPKQILQSIKKYGNVSAVVLDVSGIVENVYDLLQKKHYISLQDIVFNTNLADLVQKQQADFVVSVNLLNQLDILITDYLREQQAMSANDIMALKHNIQQHHLAQLPAGKTCLITDFEELVYYPSGELEKTNKLVFVDIPKTPDTRYWQWDFDRSQRYYEDRVTVFTVLATEI